jgi:hypothetical protein
MTTTITSAEFKADQTFAGIKICGMDLSAGNPHVWVTYEDGTTEDLFSFYTDELSFLPNEFIGLTRTQALDLWRRRDTAWLRS